MIYQVYSRYGGDYGQEEDSVEDAARMLRAGNDMGECYPLGVYDEEEDAVWVPDFLPIGPPDNEHRLVAIREVFGLPKDHVFAKVGEFVLHPDEGD